MHRDPDLQDIVLTDRHQTVYQGQVTPEEYEYLLSATRNEKGWKGRIRLHNVCFVMSWDNGLGFTGLLIHGPITTEAGPCVLSARAPLLVINGKNLTGAAVLTDAAQDAFWAWKPSYA